MSSLLLILPVLICGVLGAGIGYVYRFKMQLRRIVTVVAAVAVFIAVETTSGPLASRYSLGENLLEQVGLLPPFVFLYLLPAVFGSFFIARRFRTWAE